MSFSLPTSVGTSQAFIPVVPADQIGKYAGLAMHFPTFAAFTAAVTAERSNAAGVGGLWADGQPMTIASEAASRAVRIWSVSLNHARTVRIGSAQFVLVADANVVLAAAGAPVGGTGANGDLSVDHAAGVIYLKAAGAWATTSGVGVTFTAAERAAVIGSVPLIVAPRGAPMFGGTGNWEPQVIATMPGGMVTAGCVIKMKGILVKYAPPNGGLGMEITFKQGANIVVVAQTSIGATVGNIPFSVELSLSANRRWALPRGTNSTNIFDVPAPAVGIYSLEKIGATPPIDKLARNTTAIAFASYSAAPTTENVLINFDQPFQVFVNLAAAAGDCVEIATFTLECVSQGPLVVNYANTKATLFAGDSLTEGAGTTAVNGDIVAQLGILRKGRPMLNYGLAGQVAGKVADRVIADEIAGKYWDLIFWAGTNDGSTNAAAWFALVEAAIDRVIAFRAAGSKMIICNIIASENYFLNGGAINTARLSVNASLATKYGALVCDLSSALGTDPGGHIPSSLLFSDGAHLNEAGYGFAASTISTKMTALGWAA